MLLSLTVKNFAIIDNINIDFNHGMTVLTGETGAGKSLIIDAIGLLFGDRASNDLVRYGENKAVIEGVFSDYSSNVLDILHNNDIEEADFLVIRREIYQNGKSIANSSPPYLDGISDSRRCSFITAAACRKTSSPAACP